MYVRTVYQFHRSRNFETTLNFPKNSCLVEQLQSFVISFPEITIFDCSCTYLQLKIANKLLVFFMHTDSNCKIFDKFYIWKYTVTLSPCQACEFVQLIHLKFMLLWQIENPTVTNSLPYLLCLLCLRKEIFLLSEAKSSHEAGEEEKGAYST